MKNQQSAIFLFNILAPKDMIGKLDFVEICFVSKYSRYDNVVSTLGVTHCRLCILKKLVNFSKSTDFQSVNRLHPQPSLFLFALESPLRVFLP